MDATPFFLIHFKYYLQVRVFFGFVSIFAQILPVPGSKAFSIKNTAGTSFTHSISGLCTADTSGPAIFRG